MKKSFLAFSLVDSPALIINFEGREAKGLSKGRYDEPFAVEDVYSYAEINVASVVGGIGDQIIRNFISSTLCLLVTVVSSADKLCKQFRPRSARQNVGPYLDLNCLALCLYS